MQPSRQRAGKFTPSLHHSSSPATPASSPFFEGITGVFPVRYSARVMPDVLKTVFEELLVDEHAGGAAGVGAIDDDLFLGIKRFESLFQALKMDRAGNAFGAEHPLIQAIDQFKILAAIKLLL